MKNSKKCKLQNVKVDIKLIPVVSTHPLFRSHRTQGTFTKPKSTPNCTLNFFKIINISDTFQNNLNRGTIVTIELFHNFAVVMNPK